VESEDRVVIGEFELDRYTPMMALHLPGNRRRLGRLETAAFIKKACGCPG
jgi:hypothetical protein